MPTRYRLGCILRCPLGLAQKLQRERTRMPVCSSSWVQLDGGVEAAQRRLLCNLAAIKNMCIYDAFGVTGINTKLPALPWQSPALP